MDDVKMGIQQVIYLYDSAKRDKKWTALRDKYEDSHEASFIKAGKNPIEFTTLEDAQIFCSEVLLALTPVEFFEKYLLPVYRRNNWDEQRISKERTHHEKRMEMSDCYEKIVEFDKDNEVLVKITYVIA